MSEFIPHRLNPEQYVAIKREAAKMIADLLPYCKSHAKAKLCLTSFVIPKLRKQFENEFKDDYTESVWKWAEKQLMFDELVKAVNSF